MQVVSRVWMSARSGPVNVLDFCETDASAAVSTTRLTCPASAAPSASTGVSVVPPRVLALVGAILAWVEPHRFGSGELREPSLAGIGGHDDVHTGFGSHRVSGLRSSLEEHVDEGVSAALRFGAPQMGDVRVVAVFGASSVPIGESFHRHKRFKECFREGALRGTVAALDSGPTVELFGDTQITIFVQRVVPLPSAFRVGHVEPVFDHVRELAGVQLALVF